MTIYTDKAREVADSIIAKINNLIATHNEGTSHYKYRLWASDINPNIDSTISITCVVLDINNNPVVGQNVTLYRDGRTNHYGTKTTGNDGKASWDGNDINDLNSFGLKNFFIANTEANLQINVGGFKEVTDTNQDYYQGKDIVHLYVHYNNSLTATTSWQEFGRVVPSNIAPKDTTPFMEQFGAVILRVKTDGKLYYRSITGSQVNMSSMVAYASWKI